MDNKFSNSRTILAGALFVLSILVYSNTLYNGFVYDDEFIILENRWIKDISYIPEIFSSSMWGFKLGSDSNYYRPLVHLVLMAEYHLFGFTPWAYHLINILVHAANTVLVFLITLSLFNNPSNEGRNGPFAAFIAGAAFAVHPVHVEAIAPASVIAEMALSLFYLLTLYFYILHTRSVGVKRTLLLALSILSFSLDMFLKETAVTTLAVLFVYDLTSGRDDGFSVKSVIKRLAYIPYLAVLVLYLIVRSHIMDGLVPVKQSSYLTPFQYFLNVFPFLADYIKLFFLPLGLNAFYVFHPIYSLGELGPSTAWVLVLLASIVIAVSTKNRIALFAILWALLALAPALYIPGVGARGNAFAERYLYLPSAGFSIAAAIGFLSIFRRLPAKFSAKALLASLAMIAAVFSVFTFQRNKIWLNDYTLWRDTAVHTKDSAVVYINLGAAADTLGKREEAIEAYGNALKLSPYSAELHNNIGVLCSDMGKLDEAIEAFRKAETLTSNYGYLSKIHLNIGNVYVKKRMLDEAEGEFEKALSYNPESIKIRSGLEEIRRLREK